MYHENDTKTLSTLHKRWRVVKTDLPEVKTNTSAFTDTNKSLKACCLVTESVETDALCG